MTQLLVGTDRGLVGAGSPAPGGLDGGVTALAQAGAELWAVTDGAALWRSEGSAWERVAVSEDLRLNCVLPLEGGIVLAGTADARLLRLDGGTLQRVTAFDDVSGRDEWYTPWGGPPDVRSMSSAAERIYANVHVGGVVVSGDGGKTWSPSGLDIHADVHQVLADLGSPGRVLASTAYGLAISDDAGESWTMHDAGLHATYSRAVAVVADGLLVSASRSHAGREAAVYRFRDGTFVRLEEGLPRWFDDNIDTHCLVADGDRAALGTADGRVFVSKDGGETWDRAVEGLGRVTSVLLRPEGS